MTPEQRRMQLPGAGYCKCDVRGTQLGYIVCRDVAQRRATSPINFTKTTREESGEIVCQACRKKLAKTPGRDDDRLLMLVCRRCAQTFYPNA